MTAGLTTWRQRAAIRRRRSWPAPRTKTRSRSRGRTGAGRRPDGRDDGVGYWDVDFAARQLRRHLAHAETRGGRRAPICKWGPSRFRSHWPPAPRARRFATCDWKRARPACRARSSTAANRSAHTTWTWSVNRSPFARADACAAIATVLAAQKKGRAPRDSAFRFDGSPAARYLAAVAELLSPGSLPCLISSPNVGELSSLGFDFMSATLISASRIFSVSLTSFLSRTD